MRKHLLFTFFSLIFLGTIMAQTPNGELDDLSDFFVKTTIPIPMPDGVHLMTDITLPIFSDSLVVDLDLSDLGLGSIPIEVIPKGVQYIYYDQLNGGDNPKPYQLPLVFTRTPYNKAGDDIGPVFAILGYAHAMQDMRGRYSSEGVNLPMHSDSWSKTPYLGDAQHILDVTESDDPANSNNHEDGYHSLQYLQNSLIRLYDMNDDGIPDLLDKVCNGSIGMFGASALANTQLQLAAAHAIDPYGPGLKSLFAIVATNEHYNVTGFNNGVYRRMIVTGWVSGQIFDLDESASATDTDLQNAIHSPADYNLPDIASVAEKAVDHFTEIQYEDGLAAAYPNNVGRSTMDCSYAPVDQFGEGAADGAYSRYANMDVPTYHFSGWWDIFVNGQIDTWRKMRDNINPASGNDLMQKLVIGPWAHQTMGGTETGDMEYYENVTDIMKLNTSQLSEVDDILDDPASVFESELITWTRSTLNYNDYKTIGEPTYRIPKSNDYQEFALGTFLRFPAVDFEFTIHELLNFLTGASGLDGPKVKIYTEIPFTSAYLEIASFDIDLPALDEPLLPNNGTLASGSLYTDYADVPDVRYYVVGPVEDGVSANADAGNYWFSDNDFPPTDLHPTKMYLRNDGKLSYNRSLGSTGTSSFIHNPDNPVRSLGGANMIVETPDGSKDSQGQIDLANPLWAETTLNNLGVAQFETNILTDTLSIIGFPEAVLYAKSEPEGASEGDPTDTDFMVRILDVYPDGRELFVVEGTVSARAREYARSIVEGGEDINAPFSNIETNKIYEYHFELLPIAYTFGVGHKMKVLISSASYTRYQSNPNLPIEDGEFFRREPGDGQTYNYQGVDMAPRVAMNSVAHNLYEASHIILPVYNESPVKCDEPEGLTTEVLSPTSVMVSWDPVPDATHYQLKGKSIAQPNFANIVTTNEFKQVNGLTPGVDYVWTVRARCVDNSISSVAEPETFIMGTAKEMATIPGLMLTPNPVVDQVYITFDYNSEMDASILILDMMGKTQKSIESVILTPGQPVAVNVSELASGSYVLQVSNGFESFSEKFIKVD